MSHARAERGERRVRDLPGSTARGASRAVARRPASGDGRGLRGEWRQARRARGEAVASREPRRWRSRAPALGRERRHWGLTIRSSTPPLSLGSTLEAPSLQQCRAELRAGRSAGGWGFSSGCRNLHPLRQIVLLSWTCNLSTDLDVLGIQFFHQIFSIFAMRVAC